MYNHVDEYQHDWKEVKMDKSENLDQQMNVELVDFFKALADSTRLKIVGLLAKEPRTVEQMAGLLGLHSSTVSHHLSRLSQVGLVSARAEGYYNIYKLETKVIEHIAQRLVSKEALPDIVTNEDLDAYDRKVLKNFLTSDGRIKSFPAQEKKFKAILRYVIREFDPGVRYTEKQVNQILVRFSDDTAALRRYLVDNKMMAREGSGRAYWRTDDESKE
jgi:predicted transcriptional regulator